jgi:hypothetical protein
MRSIPYYSFFRIPCWEHSHFNLGLGTKMHLRVSLLYSCSKAILMALAGIYELLALWGVDVGITYYLDTFYI